MSAAIMGPAVSTFFNPQFSAPAPRPATSFVSPRPVCSRSCGWPAAFISMARELPSAGCSSTYAPLDSAPRAAFVTGGWR